MSAWMEITSIPRGLRASIPSYEPISLQLHISRSWTFQTLEFTAEIFINGQYEFVSGVDYHREEFATEYNIGNARYRLYDVQIHDDFFIPYSGIYPLRISVQACHGPDNKALVCSVVDEIIVL